MPTLTINGTAFTGLPQGFSGGFNTLQAGAYHSTDLKTGMPPIDGAPEYEHMLVTFDGVDGTGRIRKGFRNRPIIATLIWANTLTNAMSAHKSFFDSATQLARYTITMQGGTAYQGCVLAQANSKWFANMDGNAVIQAECVFQQFSSTN